MSLPTTERLYFADPYLTRFTARVVGGSARDGRPAVALDRTAFYPEGGGQPADRGTLGGAPVLDVQADGGVVWHLLKEPIAEEAVDGEIDWARRFDHMQQHQGQHLFSAAFEELFGLSTLAFHLGPHTSTIDLPGEVSPEQLRAAEERTNQVIWEDRAITARIVPREELATVPLRKPPAVEGAVRVVSVTGFDHSACGGTHPHSTGAVGILHVRRRERRGGETRVEFVCGGRALRDLRLRGDVLARLTAALSVGPDEVEAAVRRIQEQESEQRKRAGLLAGRLLEFEARDLVARAPSARGTRVVTAVRDDLSLGEARILANAITAQGAVAVLGLRGSKSQLIVARPDGSPVDAGAVVREVLAAEGGRGGGQPAMAQGGLPDSSSLDQAVASAARLVEGTG